VRVVVGSRRAKRDLCTSGEEKGTRPAVPTVQPTVAAGRIGGKCETAAAAATIGRRAMRIARAK